MKIHNYEVISIDPQSWRIEDDIVRALLFTGRDRALLVDSTNGGGDLAALAAELTDLPVMLVNTHADGDHIACNGQFPAAYMHPAEYPYYAEMKKPGDPPPLPVQDGEIIDLGGRCFEVIATPGHTCGSIALLDRANGILVAGDTVSSTPVYIFGRMRSILAHQASLRRLLALGDAVKTIYPAHGPFPLEREQISLLLSCAERLAAGELSPQQPPFPIPAKLYQYNGAAYFYDAGEGVK